MPLITQKVKGEYRSNDIVVSEADQAAIIALMEGEVTVYDEKSSGGTDVPTPAKLRSIRLGVSRPIDKLSCTVNIKHVKATKHIPDIVADKALFDAHWESSLSASRVRAIYEGSR